MQQFFSLLSRRLFTAQHVSGVFPPIIGSSMTAVAAFGFTFVSWWQSCCVLQDNKLKNCCIWLVIYLNWIFRMLIKYVITWSVNGDNKIRNIIWIFYCSFLLVILRSLGNVTPNYKICVVGNGDSPYPSPSALQET